MRGGDPQWKPRCRAIRARDLPFLVLAVIDKETSRA